MDRCKIIAATTPPQFNSTPFTSHRNPISMDLVINSSPQQPSSRTNLRRRLPQYPIHPNNPLEARKFQRGVAITPCTIKHSQKGRRIFHSSHYHSLSYIKALLHTSSHPNPHLLPPTHLSHHGIIPSIHSLPARITSPLETSSTPAHPTRNIVHPNRNRNRTRTLKQRQIQARGGIMR